MSTRNPTSWTQYNDESKLLARQRITTTIPSTVADDQVYVLDAPSLILSSCFVPLDTDDTGGYRLMPLYYAGMKNMAGVSGVTTTNYKWAVYAWAGDAAITEFKVKLNVGATTSIITVNSSMTTKMWRGLSSSVAWPVIESQIQLSMYVTVGGGAGKYIYVAGLMVFAEET